MTAIRDIIAPMAAVVLVTPGVEAQSPASTKSGTVLLPLGANDVDAFVKELPGEDIGQGGEFSVGRNRLVRLEGRHLTFRTASGVKKCVITPAQARFWTGNAGSIGCGDVRLKKTVNHRVRSDIGEPVVLTVSQRARLSRVNGLWQALD